MDFLTSNEISLRINSARSQLFKYIIYNTHTTFCVAFILLIANAAFFYTINNYRNGFRVWGIRLSNWNRSF